MLTLTHLAGFGGAPGYRPSGVTFDGATNGLERGANYTGLSNGKSGLISFWLDLLGGDGVQMDMLHATSGFFQLRREPSNIWRLRSYEPSGSFIRLDIPSASTYTSARGWTHYLWAWDLATGFGKLYVNDADDTGVSPTLTNDTLGYNQPAHAIMQDVSDTQRVHGALADFYMTLSETLDITVAANRRKFISATGKPVYLGDTGSLPTGSTPLVFLSSRAATFGTNLGTGGGMSVNGTLGDSSTSPGD